METLAQNKVCAKCDNLMPVACFGVNKAKADGLSHICKQCKRSVDASYRSQNREKCAAVVRSCYRKSRPDVDLSGENRTLAAKAGINKYIGKPCRVCGENQKYTSNSSCVRCTLKGESRKLALSKYKLTEKNTIRNRKNSADRRAAKLNASIQLSEEMKRRMREIYRDCPIGMEVDHIYPLVSPTICGLHVPWNLQYLSISENRTKGNRWK